MDSVIRGSVDCEGLGYALGHSDVISMYLHIATVSSAHGEGRIRVCDRRARPKSVLSGLHGDYLKAVSISKAAREGFLAESNVFCINYVTHFSLQ